MRATSGFVSNALMCVEISTGTADVSAGANPVSTCCDCSLYRSACPAPCGGRYLKTMSGCSSGFATTTTPSLKRKPWPRRNVKRFPPATGFITLAVVNAAVSALGLGLVAPFCVTPTSPRHSRAPIIEILTRFIIHLLFVVMKSPKASHKDFRHDKKRFVTRATPFTRIRPTLEKKIEKRRAEKSKLRLGLPDLDQSKVGVIGGLRVTGIAARFYACH